jgi:Transposase DDE domain
MFLRATPRKKDGKIHHYWSVVENRRVKGGRVAQRHVLYLGEINDAQRAAWCKSIAVLEEGQPQLRQMAIFPEQREAPALSCAVVHVKLDGMRLLRPRQWGACWLGMTLWEDLQLDAFWNARLGRTREGTEWPAVLKTLTLYRLIDPGSEWRLHRQWYERSAMADLLGADEALAQPNTLYRCLDLLLPHKQALFAHLKQRWETLFQASFEILLYDLTSTYFECEVPESGKRRFGYSRDKRADCVQVVIALIVTPQGFPLAYEVMNGNTADCTTLTAFVDKIQTQYGRAERIWVMDRGIPTEEALAHLRQSDPPVRYLVGTPKGRLSALERDFLAQPWEKAREAVQVKLLEREGELYVLAHSEGRVDKERAMRRRSLKKLVKRLQELQQQKLTRDELLMKLGAAKKEAGRAYALVTITLPPAPAAAAAPKRAQGPTPAKGLNAEQQPLVQRFAFTLNRQKLRVVRRREGRYLLRTNLTAHTPALLWQFYIQLTEVEQAFKELKNDLAIRPVYHQKDERIEAHIFVSFLAYCLQVTLKARVKPLASGLTPRAVLEKFAAMQMLDVHLPTTDGRELVLTRHTEPHADLRLLLAHMKLALPAQPPPKIGTPHPESLLPTVPP